MICLWQSDAPPTSSSCSRIRVDSYDTVPGGRAGDLWFEITPQSFNVRVKEGLALTQLMVFRDCADALPVDITSESLHLVFDGYVDIQPVVRAYSVVCR